jgi:hypothetical protein
VEERFDEVPFSCKSYRASSRNKSWKPLTWDAKQKRRADRKELQGMMNELRQDKEEYMNKEKKRIKEKKARDEVNKFKTASL